MIANLEKQTAHQLIDELPVQATWEDLMRTIYVRQTIEKGLDDCANGRGKAVAEIRSQYGLLS